MTRLFYIAAFLVALAAGTQAEPHITVRGTCDEIKIAAADLDRATLAMATEWMRVRCEEFGG